MFNQRGLQTAMVQLPRELSHARFHNVNIRFQSSIPLNSTFGAFEEWAMTSCIHRDTLNGKGWMK